MCAVHSKEPQRILVVDDDVDLVMLLERKLLNAGFEVETAISLPEAEDILEYFHPQLLLLDININGMDGRQLSFKLKRGNVHNNIRVIVISGYDYSASRAALFGADEFITKPFHLEYLLTRVHHHLNNLHANDRLVDKENSQEN